MGRKLLKWYLCLKIAHVCIISNMGQYEHRSIMGVNLKLLNSKYCKVESNVFSKWKHVCENNEKVIEYLCK